MIILEELDKEQTDILFEHTRRLRRRNPQLLIEGTGRGRKEKPEYAWIRKKKSPSRSRSRHGGDKKILGVLI